jgi:hypothetical protein
VPWTRAERAGMIDAELTLRAGHASKRVALSGYLDPPAEERAHHAAYAWIKSLRHLPIDGIPFRDRFRAREDSLWWFTELYLHKQQTILDVHRTIFALRNVFEQEAPSDVQLLSPSPVITHVAQAFVASRTASPARVKPITWLKRLAALDARARALTLSALATRDRWRSGPGSSRATLAAFVHRAFWQQGQDEGAAEAYVGPVLRELEHRLQHGEIRYVGVGPVRNFRTHRRLRPSAEASTLVIPVERFASPAALAESRAVWRQRFTHFRALTQSHSVRIAASIEGIDCWPIVREALAGIAWLQWPWSVRAMDEAAAALVSLRPQAVLTYAEAGGWGRALVLEARRLGIPSIGLQHGFIYRHWLNYRHEPDEMQATATREFPLPTRTLLFDAYAARHLEQNGRFPAERIQVTGSPRLDELVAEAASLTSGILERLRDEIGVSASHQVLLVATKEREARTSLPALLEAASRIPDVTTIIKPHPAESADVYSAYVRDRQNLRVAKGSISLAQLLALARAVVTVNSTVALDAGVLGVPSLAIGLPNNLSPFVDAGALAGSTDAADLPRLLRRILYDEEFRQQLAARRLALFGPGAGRQGGSAARSAEAIMEVVRQGCARPAAQEG